MTRSYDRDRHPHRPASRVSLQRTSGSRGLELLFPLVLLTALGVLAFGRQNGSEPDASSVARSVVNGDWTQVEMDLRRLGSFRDPIAGRDQEDVLSELSRFAETDAHYGNIYTGMRLLLKGGADPNARGGAPLGRFYLDRHGKILRRLLRAGADPNRGVSRTGFSFLVGTIEARLPLNAMLLLRYGADANAPARTSPHDWLQGGLTTPPHLDPKRPDVWRDRMLPLSVAARRGDPEMVALLLKYDAKPNARDPETGMTPLHHAAEANRPEIVRLLLGAGSSRTTRDRRGRTPLAAAREGGAKQAVRELGG